MPLIFRATKDGSTDGNYVPFVIIQSDEVNGDFNPLYELVDGKLADDNIAAGANIDPAKLNRSTPWVNSADIIDGSIVNADIAAGANISRSKLAAPIIGSGSGVVGLTIPANIATTVATISPIVFDGGYVQLLPALSLTYSNGYTGALGGFTVDISWVWFRDTTALTAIIQPLFHPAGNFDTTSTVAVPGLIEVPPSTGTFVYSLEVLISNPSGTSPTIHSHATNPGFAYAIVIR